MNGVVLAVDIGTSSLKAALIDARGTVVGSARCRFPPAPRRAKDWTDALSEATFCVTPALKASGKTIDAVSVSGNGPTLVAVDSVGRPLDILMWNDQIPEPAGVSANYASLFIPRILAYRERFPESWKSAKRVLSGPEYLVWYLTGEAVTILPDARYESAYWTGAELSRAGIDGRKLAPFVAAGAVVGAYDGRLRAVDAESGGPGTAFGGGSADRAGTVIPRGTPVVAGGPDFTVALVGTGTIRAGTACDRAGTSEGLNVCTEAPASHPLVRSLPAAVPGLWNASYLLPDTGARFHEWRARTGQGARPYADIMRDVARDVETGTESEARSVVEGIGRSVRAGVAALRETTGFSGEFALSGGQARNATWNRLKAAMANATFAMMETPDGELMGNAALAYRALGAYRSLEDAVAGMVRVAERYGPEPALAALFDERFGERSRAT